MDTLKSPLKYTIILSAYQTCPHACNTKCICDLNNMLNTEKLAIYLRDSARIDYQRAVGVYRGSVEQSFVVSVNSVSRLSMIKTHLLEVYNQESVLISNNRRQEISLHYASGKQKMIGKCFVSHASKPSADSFTVLNGVDYYTVY